MSNGRKHASMRAAETISACIAALVLSGTPAHAQRTFDVLTEGAVGNIPGLRALTVRDNSISVCYTLFILESSTGPLPVAAPDPTTAQSVERVRALAEERDKQLAALQQKYPAGTDVVPLQSELEYEQARLRLDLEYQRALRHEIPESSPWASMLPGMRSGGYEDAANANRRATLDPDPTSAMKTIARQFALQIDLLRLLIEAPRMTTSAPFACPPGKP